MKRAIAYLRVSTEEQRLGPHAQRAAIERWAAQHQIRVVAWCTDQGLSGTLPPEARPQLMVALRCVQDERADFLVVSTRDRLARDALQAALLDRQVRKLGARIVAADRGLDDTDEEKLLAGILDHVAEFERRRIAARIKGALAVKKKRKERVGGVPIGWKASGKTLVPWPEEQALIGYVHQLFTGGQTVRQICRTCRLGGIKSLRTGGFLSPHQIHRLLRANVIEVA